MKLINFVLNSLLFLSIGCTTSLKTEERMKYTVYYNDPKIMHAVQPWPFEKKAKKTFEIVSTNIDLLFHSKIADNKNPSENSLFYGSDSKIAGHMRLEREELVIAISENNNQSTIYIDRKINAWRDGYRVLATPEVLQKIVEEIDYLQKSIPVRSEI